METTLSQFHEDQLKKFGQRLRQIRKQRNMSQTDLEVVSGIYVAEISKMENGLQNLEFYTLSRLAFVFKVDILEFFKFELLPSEEEA
jgi:HTH-type transcriptional regulator, competence development regulator